MKKWFIGILLILAALVSCSKPENGDELSLLSNDPIEAIAVALKNPAASIQADIKGISDTCHSRTFTLLAGKTTDIGTVVVANDLNFIYVTYNTTGDWDLSEVHLYVLDYEPAERLAPGQAPFKSGILPDGTTTYTFTIPLSETLLCGSSIWLQAHATVDTETAFGGTIVPDPENGAWYGNIAYTVECCEPPEEECKISASAVADDVKCYGASTGTIDLTVADGTAPLNYLWSNGATTEDLADIPAGNYSVTVTDANQCVAIVDDIIVLQPSEGISALHVVTDISAFGAHDGAIDVTVTGGTPPYSFLWNNDATTEDLSDLGPGLYSVTITDANGCNIALRELLVEEPDEEKPEGIVAFARKTYEPMVHCFLGLDLDGTAGADFTQWGWTNGALPETEGFTSRYELFINAGGCDVANATKVGDIAIQHFGGTTTATFTLLPGFTMSETALYAGNEILPKVGADFTIDPAMYPYIHTSLGSATTDTYSVTASGNIYVIGYALINPVDGGDN